MAQPRKTGTTRRSLLRGSGAAALMLSFNLPAGAARVAGSKAKPRPQATGFAPNSCLHIATDNRITIVCASAEMGQGVHTSLSMLLAEELDADWNLVSVVQAPADPGDDHPMLGPQATGGSSSARGFWEPLRKAGAAAREMLVAAAAAQWQLSVETLRTERSQVIAPDGRKLSYGALAAAASRQPVPANPGLKENSQFRLLGKAIKRLDTAQKVNGEALYGIDAQLEGLWVGVMARAPLPGAKAKAFDEAAAKAVPGVHQVLSIPSGVAVLAEGYWAAQRGRDALAVEWDLGEAAGLSSAGISEQLHAAAATAEAPAREEGDVREAAAAGTTTIAATYEAPYLAHACMEPMNCTAQVRGDEVELWVGTQSQGPQQGNTLATNKLAPTRLKVNTMLLGGGFGRRFAPDFTRDATLLSRLSGRPVKLMYSREDDMAAGYYRPAAVARFEAALDAQGLPTMIKADVAAPSLMAASGFMKLPPSGVDAFAMEGIADHPYDIANQRIRYGRAEPGLQAWFWRSGGHSQNVFFLESFIDELAAAARQDPFEFRRVLLSRQPRCKAVLELAAERAHWGKPLPAGVARGIALAQCCGSHVAEVAEVSVAADGALKVHRIVAAVECGLAINPEIIRRQIEGGIAFGLSAALYGRITVADGLVQQRNFDDYPVLRMHQMPRVDVHILPHREAPGGVGGAGTAALAPAVANAIFAATGKRIRSLPIEPELIRAA